jgi:retron-type reverse transcriptase
MRKKDVLEFSLRAEENLFYLIADLRNGNYTHGQYIRFIVCDPKRREIAKAPVRDRVLHHALCRVLTPLFEPSFVFDSYSSRKEKGIHKAGKRLDKFAQKLAHNHTKTIWILQVDMRKFFDSVDHEILFSLLRKKIKNEKVLSLLEIIIQSYEKSKGKGIPLGNLTSQLFSNVYLDLLDNFVKRELQAKYYLRYADDIIILSRDKNFLEDCLSKVANFIEEKLKLDLHPKKISLKRWKQGIDFLGYVHFPTHSVLRTKTKRRMIGRMAEKNIELKNKKISDKSYQQSLQSYFGVLKHCRGRKIKTRLESIGD